MAQQNCGAKRATEFYSENVSGKNRNCPSSPPSFHQARFARNTKERYYPPPSPLLLPPPLDRKKNQNLHATLRRLVRMSPTSCGGVICGYPQASRPRSFAASIWLVCPITKAAKTEKLKFAFMMFDQVPTKLCRE